MGLLGYSNLRRYCFADCRDNWSLSFCTDDMDYNWYTGVYGHTASHQSGL